jgi:hypothetical protein
MGGTAVTDDAPLGYRRSVSGEVGTTPDHDGPAGEHGPDDDLRRAHDEHPCRCAHHRETGDDR